MAEAVGESLKKALCFCRGSRGKHGPLCKNFRGDGEQRFLIGGGGGADLPLAVVDGAAAVKGIDGFAVILDAHVIYIEDWHVKSGGFPAEKAVAFLIFS